MSELLAICVPLRVVFADTCYLNPGTGKPLEEATAEELAQDMAERVSENPLAYQGNKLEFAMSDAEVRAAAAAKNK